MIDKHEVFVSELAKKLADAVSEKIKVTIDMDFSDVNLVTKEQEKIERVQLDDDPFADPDHKLEWRKGDSDVERLIYKSRIGE